MIPSVILVCLNKNENASVRKVTKTLRYLHAT